MFTCLFSRFERGSWFFRVLFWYEMKCQDHERRRLGKESRSQMSCTEKLVSKSLHHPDKYHQISTSSHLITPLSQCKAVRFLHIFLDIYIYINMFLLIFLLSLGSYDFVQNQGTPNCSDLVPRFSQLDNIFSERTHRMLYSTWCFFGFG